MNSRDLVRMALGNLWRRKLRTFLTILGVIIGTTSIVVMLSLGLGMKESNQRMIETWGDITQITVTPPGVWAGGYGMGGGEQENNNNKHVKLDDRALESFRILPSVVAVTPIKEEQMTITSGRYEAWANVKAVLPEATEALGIKLADGRYLKQGEKNGVIFGGLVSSQFYNPNSRNYEEVELDPMRDRFKIGFMSYGMPDQTQQDKAFPIDVVGVTSDTNWMSGNVVYVSLDTFDKWQKEKPKDPYASGQDGQRRSKKEYERAIVKIDDVKNVEYMSQYLKDLGYNTYSLQDEAKEFEKSTNIVQAILGGIGGISLLVAAIGITNTMIMSIYERTKEIGIMKVIGAAIHDIKKLFLVEAAFIGLAGGMLGALLSLGISAILNVLAGNALGADMADMGMESIRISVVPLWLVLTALVFSAMIGLIAGYLPARRAMKLSALEAIRTE